jgi:hypothetical protein
MIAGLPLLKKSAYGTFMQLISDGGGIRDPSIDLIGSIRLSTHVVRPRFDLLRLQKQRSATSQPTRICDCDRQIR